jgi:hypothetical protein
MKDKKYLLASDNVKEISGCDIPHEEQFVQHTTQQLLDKTIPIVKEH